MLLFVSSQAAVVAQAWGQHSASKAGSVPPLLLLLPLGLHGKDALELV